MKYPSLQEYAIEMMKVLDKNNDGFVDIIAEIVRVSSDNRLLLSPFDSDSVQFEMNDLG